MYSFNNIPIQKSVIFVLRRVSLKSKDSITTPNHFVTRTIRTVQLSAVQLCLETKENKKGNTIINFYVFMFQRFIFPDVLESIKINCVDVYMNVCMYACMYV